MRSLTLIDRYLAKGIAVPLAGTLVLAAMLLVLEKLLRLFDFVINAGGPVSVVWRMLANLLPQYFSLGIPIGLLLGILLAFRKLAGTSELDALRGIGVGYGRMLKVPMFYAAALMFVNLAIVGWLQPLGEYRYEGLRFDLRSGALGAAVSVGDFNRFGDRMTVRIDHSDDKGARLHGIFVSVNGKDGQRIDATAEEGRFLATDDPDTILFRLKEGRLVQREKDFEVPRTLSFQTYDLPIPLPAIDTFRGRGDDNDELFLPELVKNAYFGGVTAPTELQTIEQRVRGARANLHFRLVEVLMMLMLPMLAIALAVPAKRSSSSLGIFVAIVMVVTYHKVNQYALGAANNGKFIPEVALYVPFLLFIALIFWMYHVIAHKPGGQPIGALERVFEKFVKAVKWLLRTGKGAVPRRQTEEPAAEGPPL